MKFTEIDILEFGHTIQITGMILSRADGIDHEDLLVKFPDEPVADYQNVTRLDMTTEDWEKFLHQTDVLNVEIIGAGDKKAIVRKSQRQIDQNVAWEVFRRDHYKCRYCGKFAPLSVDHVDLWESGGVSVQANLLSACKKCNRTRGRRLYADWLKSVDYARLSQGLEQYIKDANVAVLELLPELEAMRTTQIRSR